MEKTGYKTKTIKSILKTKLDKWLVSIKDQDVRNRLRQDVIVTGGSITSMLMGDEIKDFDIYFKTKETTIAVAQYYCKVFKEQNPSYDYEPVVKIEDDRVSIFIKSAGVAESDDAGQTEEAAYEDNLGEGRADFISKPQATEEVKKETFRPVFLSANAITLTDKIQLVIRFYGDATEIHKNYDFEHCKNVYDYGTGELHLKTSALAATMSKTLVYTGSLYPICSLFRMRKFIDRGWRISAGEILKMAWQVSELDLKDTKVIKEQLTGCDQAYMRRLINVLEHGLENNPELNIDSEYIVQLVDEVFNDA